MLDSRRIAITNPPQGTALTARERLLRDKQLRRNRPDSTTGARLLVPPITATFSTMLAGTGTSVRPCLLSPAEQKRRAIQVARSFKHYVLSEITYLDDRRLAVAVTRPIRAYTDHFDLPQQICVDPDGNVSIYSTHHALPPARHLAAGRVLLTVGGILTVLGTIVFFALI